jgi:DNA-binding transcriptional ArsR family regulator
MTKTLGHPARLRILAMLRHNRLSVCQIASVLGVPPSTASGYLTELRRADLVTEQREGKWVFYQPSDEAPQAALLGLVLVLLDSDPHVGRDAAAARRLKDTSPELTCGSSIASGTATESAVLGA